MRSAKSNMVDDGRRLDIIERAEGCRQRVPCLLDIRYTPSSAKLLSSFPFFSSSFRRQAAVKLTTLLALSYYLHTYRTYFTSELHQKRMVHGTYDIYLQYSVRTYEGTGCFVTHLSRQEQVEIATTPTSSRLEYVWYLRN